MIRIFIVGFSDDRGGVEAYISNLNDSLDHTKFEVIYCLPEMTIDGRVWVAPKNRHNYFAYKRFWHKFFKCNKFDVIYYNTCDIVSIDMLKFAKAANIPIRIIHSHNTNVQQKLRLIHKFTEKYNRKHIEDYATHLFACSGDAGKWMFGDKHFTVLKNGIDISKYKYSDAKREACRSNLKTKKQKVIGCVGRLDPQKNPLFTLKIMEAVKEIDSDTAFVFVGDGELKGALSAEIKKLQLDSCVYLIGNRNDVNEWYSAFDCLLMPSLFEGFPFVLVEAQAAGLPCVVSSSVSEDTNLTGLVEFVGLDDSVETWASTILNACEKSRKDTTKELIDAGYSIENTANYVSDIIKNSLKKNG